MPDDSPTTPVVFARRHRPSIRLFAGLMILLLTADLLTKHLAFQYVSDQPTTLTGDIAADRAAVAQTSQRTVISNVFALRLTINEGAVFGLGKGRRWLFVVISLIAAGVIGYVFAKSRAGHWSLHVPLAMILSGALGNLYDRFVFGVVRDMCWLFPGVELPFGWRWPGDSGGNELYPWIFNVADVALLAGVIWLILFGPRKTA